MNTEIAKGKWKELRGSLKAHWDELTEDDLDYIDGRLNELEGRLQNRYGWERDQTREAVNRFLKTVRF